MAEVARQRVGYGAIDHAAAEMVHLVGRRDPALTGLVAQVHGQVAPGELFRGVVEVGRRLGDQLVRDLLQRAGFFCRGTQPQELLTANQDADRQDAGLQVFHAVGRRNRRNAPDLPDLGGIGARALQQNPAERGGHLHVNRLANLALRLRQLERERSQPAAGDRGADLIAAALAAPPVDGAHRPAVDFEDQAEVRANVGGGPDRHGLVGRNVHVHPAGVGGLMPAPRLLEVAQVRIHPRNIERLLPRRQRAASRVNPIARVPHALGEEIDDHVLVRRDPDHRRIGGPGDAPELKHGTGERGAAGREAEAFDLVKPGRLADPLQRGDGEIQRVPARPFDHKT